MAAENLAYLFRYDSVYGTFPGEVSFAGGHLNIDGNTVKVFQQPDPLLLPWQTLGVDVVIECTGSFSTREGATLHLQAGAALYQRRQGQLNLSCAQCHDQQQGRRLYSDRLSQGQPNGYPVYRLEWQTLGSLERRLRSCFAGIRAEPPPWGDQRMRQLALYLTWRGEGLPIEVPAVRK